MGDTASAALKGPLRIVFAGLALGLAVGVVAQMDLLPRSWTTPLSLHRADHPVCAEIVTADGQKPAIKAAFADASDWKFVGDAVSCGANVYIIGLTDTGGSLGLTSIVMFEPRNNEMYYSAVSVNSNRRQAFNVAVDAIREQYRWRHENPTSDPDDIEAVAPTFYRDGRLCVAASAGSPMRRWLDDEMVSLGLKKIDGQCKADLRVVAVSTSIKNGFGGIIGFAGAYAVLQRAEWGLGERRGGIAHATSRRLVGVQSELSTMLGEDYRRMTRK